MEYCDCRYLSVFSRNKVPNYWYRYAKSLHSPRNQTNWDSQEDFSRYSECSGWCIKEKCGPSANLVPGHLGLYALIVIC